MKVTSSFFFTPVHEKKCSSSKSPNGPILKFWILKVRCDVNQNKKHQGNIFLVSVHVPATCALPSTKKIFLHKRLYYTLPYSLIPCHTFPYHNIHPTRQLICSKPCVFSPKIIHKFLRSGLMIFVEKSYNKFIFLWHDGTICAMSDPAPDSRPIRIVKDDKNLQFDYTT